MIGVRQQYPPVKCTAPFVSRNYSPLCPETRSGYSVQETPCATTAVFLSDIYVLTRLALPLILYYVIRTNLYRDRSTP
jgi:hypothetical protein